MELNKEIFVMKRARKAFIEKHENFSATLTGNELREYNQWRNAFVGAKRWDESDVALKESWYVQAAFFSKGMIGVSSDSPAPDETVKLLERFAKVFDSTYIRFNDLQKAESQAREAQIELGLERVRARAMAMQSSAELKEVVKTLFEELNHLDVNVQACLIATFDAATLDQRSWMIHLKTNEPYVLLIPYNEQPFYQEMLKAWKERNANWAYMLEGETKIKWEDFLFADTDFRLLPQLVKEEMQKPEKVFFAASYYTYGAIQSSSPSPFSKQSIDILQRFSKVFDSCYTRFLDLQKAEAQAKEAQIELGLERVRARAMAMQKSDELKELIGTVFSELTKLDLVLTRCVIMIYDSKTLGITWWMANSEDPSNPMGLFVKYHTLPPHLAYIKAWKERELNWQYVLEGKIKKEWDDFLFVETELSYLPDFVIAGMKAPDRVYLNASFNSFGNLTLATLEPLSNEHADILLRFAKVFDLTYTRFNDLQKAEAQAKEAQIEASLERVRGKAMSMHSSRDLADTIDVFYHEMELLSVTPRRCGVGLMDKETHVVELSTMNTTEQGDSIEIIGKLKLTGHPVLEGIYDNWILQKEYHPVLKSNEIKKYYQLIRPQISYPDYPTDTAQYGYFFFFNEGGVYAWTEKELSEDELQIYRRFTSVLSLTYKRYKDLEKAEASAKEALKQSALDRIRADIASMRTVSDLDRITPLIWNELTILGVPFIRCGVFIMDDEQQQIHTFLSTPEGKGIAAFHLPYNTPGNIAHVISHWYKKEIYTDHWDKEAFKDFAENLVQQGAMKSSEQYLQTMPAGGFDLHFVPFQQGMLYVGNIAPLGAEEINLLQSIADAFSTAYARYQDFNKLEAAKKQVDNTLTELKQAQQQLVQSEKMASLGELTAGIAHEIQNPLNFVNNFSEVSNELIDEMNNELEKGEIEEAREIASDLKQNLEKINHHGKRADAIVKGMLQHSRKSTGQKEPTDINALADEYLRLSFHGLRAKDKNFNATIETDFDNSIGKINIIPQDIGRVLLNLFNNAFYAVNEQKNKNLISYEPKVFVHTQKCDGKIQISVRDNGNGIPKKILDKIFQPFFTTKPTGQGTGLGLSLSYDIIKAHGGEIKVESEEGEGSEFVIQLPNV
jgi:signal transduction histidine kinase/DNA-directed RNA polymerase subunit N (RpoN/RPB10)